MLRCFKFLAGVQHYSSFIFINLLIPEVSSITINVWIIFVCVDLFSYYFIKSIQLNMYLYIDYKLMIRTTCIWSIVN